MKEVHGLRIPTGLEEMCRPERIALLVYDMQLGVLNQIADAGRVVKAVSDVVEMARRAGVRIVYVRHTSLPKSWMGVTQFRMAMAWQRQDDPEAVSPWFLRDNPAVAITPEIAPTEEDAVFDKLSMSAFEGTPLAFALRDCGLDCVAIVGVATEIGIEPTVRHAADLGFIPIIIQDACGAGHAEAADRSFASLDFAGDAVLTNVESFRAALEAA